MRKNQLGSIGVCVIIIAFILALYLFHCTKYGHSGLGQFGDLFGGIIGTIVSAITLWYLIITVDEMRNQNKLIINQNEHNSFIMLLHNYHEVINDLDTIKTNEKDKSVILTGREAIEHLFLSTNPEELEKLKHIVESAIIILQFPEKSNGNDTELDKRREEYQKHFTATLSTIEKNAILKIKNQPFDKTNVDSKFEDFVKSLTKKS